MEKYVRRNKVLEVLDVHYQTLYRMEDRGEIDVIRSKGNHRLYNLEKYMKENNIEKPNKLKICYCRVSSGKQKDNLKNQVSFMKKNYPNHEIIKDIGSGLNMKRKGLQRILELAIEGKINEIVVAYKDRLTRFGYDMIEWIVDKYSNGKIIIVNRNEEETPEEEITKDILQIMNVYVAKINGRRKYSKKVKQD